MLFLIIICRMKVIRICCLAIMFILWSHPTTTQIIVPRPPPNIGSCSLLTFSDMENTLRTAVEQEGYSVHRLEEYQPLCSVSGIYRDTYSQYSVLVKFICKTCGRKKLYTTEVVQVTFICHRSTNSYWRPNVTHPKGPVIYFHHTAIFQPNKYNPKCGECARLYNNPQFCGGMC